MENNNLNAILEEEDVIASPSVNPVESFINDPIASMNKTFFLPRIAQNEDSLLSLSPTPKSPRPQTPTLYDIDDMGINTSAAKAIHSRILQDLQVTFNRKAVEFFQQFEQRLENIVDMKLNCSTSKDLLQDAITSTAVEASQINTIEEKLSKFDDNYEDFTDKYNKFNQINDKMETSQESLVKKINSIKAEITQLSQGLKNLQLNVDEKLSKKIQENQAPPAVSPTNSLQLRVRSLETQIEQFSVQLDNVEQNTRQYILQFENIVNRGSRDYPECATDVIISFLWNFLGMCISNRHISICHRQDIPSLRKKLGKKYIEPIYCKFLNRSVVHEILRRKHLLKHARNEHNGPYFIKENLTLNRRLLWDSVEENSAILDING